MKKNWDKITKTWKFAAKLSLNSTLNNVSIFMSEFFKVANLQN